MRDRRRRALIAGGTWVSFGLHLKRFAIHPTGGHASGLAA
jgi:hypothetical protein